jgi:hypothetical protein
VYAKIPINDHYETWNLRSKGFRRWLSGLFYRDQGKAPNAQAMNDALTTIEGLGQFESPQAEIHVRVASHDGKIYLDLGNDGWEVVEITTAGWKVIQDSPVHFRRPKGMLRLPHPDPNGSIEELKPFLNLPEGDEGERMWRLIIGWLVQGCNPSGPYPLLVLHGEQGSAKSTISRLLRSIFDPSTVPLRTSPRSERDLAITANNNWILVFDNISFIKDWLSDAICRLSTGGGFSTRELWTNDEECLFSSTRPVILNGIDEMVTRHDLADRCIFLNFPPIPDRSRITERGLIGRFDKCLDRILGGILNVITTALTNIATTKLEEIPRMADFALWVQAAESALPWESGGFLAAYNQNRKDVIERALHVDMVAAAIRKLMETRDFWEGTASELLDKLENDMADKETRRKEWPKSPATLSRKIIRLASFLRRVGINVQRQEPKGRSRAITLERINTENDVHTVHGVQKADLKGLDSDDSGRQDTKLNDNTSDTVLKNGQDYQEDNDMDDMDDSNPILSISPNKPTPKSCGDCENYEVDHMRISCKLADVAMKHMEKCPLDKI